MAAASAVVPAINSLIGIVTGLLGQHTARVKAATDENSAANAIVPAYDSDLAQIRDAYNTGASSGADCESALQSVDAQVYGYLHSQVGKAGTSWSGTGCDKRCTVGCCIYNNDLRPGIQSMIAAIQAGSGTAHIPKVYGSKYGLQAREGYSIAIVSPPAGTKITGAINSVVDQLLGKTPASLPGVTGVPQNTNSLLLVGFGVLAILVAYAAGSK